MPQEQISTGIDRLVALIREKKSISLKNAAKELGISVALIEEWGNFLEEEGVLDYKYKLSGAHLVERQISDGYIAKSEKGLGKKKNGLVKNINSNIKDLDKHKEKIVFLKKNAKKILERVGTDFDHIRDDIKSLKGLEEVHDELSQEIIENDKYFAERIKTVGTALDKETKKYDQLMGELKRKDKEISTHGSSLMKLKEQEDKVHKDLEYLEKVTDKIKNSISEKNQDIAHDVADVKVMKKEIQLLRSEMKEQRKLMDDMMKEKVDKEVKIEKISKDIAKKIGSKKVEIKKGMEDINEIQSDFVDFMSKKKIIKSLLHDTDRDTLALESDINSLIKEAQRLDRLSKSSEISEFSKEIKKAYTDLKQKRSKVNKDYKKLSGVFADMVHK